jgi:hypothetical protein
MGDTPETALKFDHPAHRSALSCVKRTLSPPGVPGSLTALVAFEASLMGQRPALS